MDEQQRRAIEQRGIKYTDGGSSLDSRVAWTSTTHGHEPDFKLDPMFNDLGQQVNSTPQRDINIFKHMDPASWFATTPQKTIEDIMSLKPGDDVFMFDIENVGTFNGRNPGNLPWYSPTEIAVGRRKVSRDFRFVQGKGYQEASLLVKPTDDALAHIDNLISKVSSMGVTWKGLSADEHRTLNDLILYSNNDPFQNGYFTTSKKTGATYLNRQARSGQAMKQSVFTFDQIQKIKKGRDNLVSHGSSADQVIMELDNLFAGAGNIRIAGYNVDSYDIPLMLDYVNNHLGKNVIDSKARTALARLQGSLHMAKSVDVFRTVKTFYKDQASSFGKNLRQSDMAEILGISKGTAHRAADDLNTTADIWNHLVTKRGLIQGIQNGGGQVMGARFDTTSYKVGDKLFSLSGLGSSKTGPFDMVFGPDFKPAYPNFKPNPLYKGTEYTLSRTGTMDLGGALHHVALLHNTDDDLYHFIARENPNDLREVFQRNMVPYEHVSALDRYSAKKGVSMDRARRQYLRLFSEEGGGATGIRKMLHGVTAWKEARAQGMSESDTKNYVAKQASIKGAKYRDMTAMADRLDAERPYIESFLTELEKSPLDKTSSQGTALNHFRKMMDERFGQNTTSLDLGEANKVFQFNLEGDTQTINLRSNHTIESSLRSMVYRDYGKNVPIRVVKQRLMSLVHELRTSAIGKADDVDAGKSGLSYTVARQAEKQINELREGDSYDTLLAELSGRIEQAREYDQTQGFNRMGSRFMKVEYPNAANPTRLHKMAQASSAEFYAIHQSAISRALSTTSAPWDGKGLHILDPFTNNLLDQNDKIMQGMLSYTGADQAKNLELAHDTRLTLSNLARAYTDDNTAVAFLYDGKHKGLVMAIANKKDAEQIFNLLPNEIIENNKVATVAIPLHNERGQLAYGRQVKTGRLFSIDTRAGARLGSGFDVVTAQLQRMARPIREYIGSGEALRARSWMKSTVSETVNSLSANNKRMSDLDDIYNFDEKKSRRAIAARQGVIDTSGFAPSWYAEKYGVAARDRKRAQMTGGTTFVDTLDRAEQARFNREISGWLSERHGIQTSIGSVKDTHAANYLRAARDIREFSPFGFLDSMTRENKLKSVNYLPLDVRRSITGLSENVSSDNLKRITSQTFVSDVGQAVDRGEFNFLNLRAAYLNTPELNRLMQNKLGSVDAYAHTHDGMFIVADDVAKGFVMSREKNIRMAEGGTVHKDIWKLLIDHGEMDADGNYSLHGLPEEERDLYKLLPRVENPTNAKNGQIKVGDLMRDGRAREEYFHQATAGRAYIKGYNKDRNTLIIDEVDQLTNGMKMNTEAGARLTVSIRDRAWFNNLGVNADMIMPEYDLGKGQTGSFVASQVRLVLDEAIRNIHSDVTVGEMKKAEMVNEAMNTASELMNTHLKIDKGVRVVDGQIVMDGFYGADGHTAITMQGLHNFMSDASRKLGIQNFLANPIMYGQENAAISDVYNWENAIGLTRGTVRTINPQTGEEITRQMEHTDGLVRWTPKEVEAIRGRANRYLEKDNVVSKWLDSHTGAVAKAQSAGFEDYARGLIRATRDITDKGLQAGNHQAGDIIVRTRGDSFSVGNIVDDREGRRTGRIVNGVTEVSMHAFNDLPSQILTDQVFSAQDYQKTILNAGGLDVNIYDGEKKTDKSFSQLLRNNKGTFLFELPDDSFGRRYVRMADSTIAEIPKNSEQDQAVLNKTQRSQTRIMELTKQYQAAPTPELHQKLKEAVTKYDNHVAFTIDSSRDGSILDKLFSTNQDMSGRFRVQGLNPMAMGQEEGVLKVSRDRMRQMITGAHENVAKTLGMETSSSMDQVLDKLHGEGLYGFVNRYPTIHESTNAVLKVMVDDKVKGAQGFLSVGTAVAMNADYDGDFISNVLAHYSHDDAPALHQALSTVHARSVEEYSTVADMVRNDIQSKARETGMSVDKIWETKDYHRDIVARVGALQELETSVARLGKSDVGVLDNLRARLSNVTAFAYKNLAGKEGFSSDQIRVRQARIDEFGQMVSQKAISSKKFTKEAIDQAVSDEMPHLTGADKEAEIVARMDREKYIRMLEEGINAPSASGIEKIKRANVALGIFDTGPNFTRTTKQTFSLDEMLQSLQEGHELYGGKENWLRSDMSKFGQSGGYGDAVSTSKVLWGQSGMTIENPILERVAELDHGVKESLAPSLEYTRKSFEAHHNRLMGRDYGVTSRIDDGMAAQTSQSMIDDSVVKQVSTPIKDISEKLTAGLGGGATGFGAMKGAAALFGGLWAASALLRSGPTPEETIRGKDGVIDNAQPPRGSAMSILKGGGPIARISPNGESINIKIAAKDANRIGQDQIAAMVHQELSAMMPMQLNMNATINDNTQTMDKQYLQQIVTQAFSTGRIL